MAHDRYFKEVVSSFFAEFIGLVLPKLVGYIDPIAAILPLDKELFSDILSGDQREVDLVMKVKVRGKEAFFLIHVENQATRQTDFPRRMFHYCARLMEKYNLPVYPVVIFSYDKPTSPEPNFYEVEFPGLTVLRFEYTVLQLNRIPWRHFANIQNPVACALMAKLDIPVAERPMVKLQCLRLLATLKLDPAKTSLISGFIDNYLALTAQELAEFERELALLDPEERQSTLEITTSWEQKGIEIGIERGKEELILLQINRKFGPVPESIVVKVEGLSSSQLDDLGLELFEFSSIDDVTQWLPRS